MRAAGHLCAGVADGSTAGSPLSARAGHGPFACVDDHAADTFFSNWLARGSDLASRGKRKEAAAGQRRTWAETCSDHALAAADSAAESSGAELAAGPAVLLLLLLLTNPAILGLLAELLLLLTNPAILGFDEGSLLLATKPLMDRPLLWGFLRELEVLEAKPDIPGGAALPDELARKPTNPLCLAAGFFLLFPITNPDIPESFEPFEPRPAPYLDMASGCRARRGTRTASPLHRSPAAFARVWALGRFASSTSPRGNPRCGHTQHHLAS